MGSGLEKKHRDTVAIQENNPFNTGETGLVLWPPPSKILTPRWVPPPPPQATHGQGHELRVHRGTGTHPHGGVHGPPRQRGGPRQKGGLCHGMGGGGPF